MKNIFIGGAWPYANGSLHIGHIAALLPGDVLARYYRAKGNPVFYVSGSDCHGTPVTIRAKQEGKSPKDISNSYHDEFMSIFEKLGFSYDLYGKTSDDWHINFVQDFHRKMYASEYICEKTVPQAYCSICNKVLTDRLVTGNCPQCGNPTRGDQCDSCGSVLEAESILNPTCSECGNSIQFNNTTQLYIEIPKLEKELKTYLNSHLHWRKNAISFTKRYIDEGLRERAITRDLEWGINVPKKGYENKKIYIWAENVLGYLSASKELSLRKGIDFNDIWGDNSRHYYVHGKDNIPFHTIILPSLLMANGHAWHLPDDIISSEHLTLEGKKISTSQNWAIWVKDIVDTYNSDSIRFYLLSNGPEKKDSDFSWKDFIESNNSELVGAYGNLINRTLAFIHKYQNGIVPTGILSEEVRVEIEKTYTIMGEKIENGNFREAIDEVFSLVRFGNKYYDFNQPWKTRMTNAIECNDTLFNCVQIISNLAVLLSPFLPFSSNKILNWLNLSCIWEQQYVETGYKLPPITILFDRIDKSRIENELTKLESMSHKTQ